MVTQKTDKNGAAESMEAEKHSEKREAWSRPELSVLDINATENGLGLLGDGLFSRDSGS